MSQIEENLPVPSGAYFPYLYRCSGLGSRFAYFAMSSIVALQIDKMNRWHHLASIFLTCTRVANFKAVGRSIHGPDCSLHKLKKKLLASSGPYLPYLYRRNGLGSRWPYFAMSSIVATQIEKKEPQAPCGVDFFLTYTAQC